jgi:hypothetical protein
VQLPRKPLLTAWALLVAAAYYQMWFTPWGEFSPTATTGQTLLAEATMVVAGLACWEVMRTERVTALRAVAGAVGFPLALVLLYTLWYGLQRHFGG